MKIIIITHIETGQIVALNFPGGSRLNEAMWLLSDGEVDVFRGRDGFEIKEGEVKECPSSSI